MPPPLAGMNATAPVLWTPLRLSLQVAATATFFSFVAATLAAWRLSRTQGPVPAFLDALCSLPLVLPPTVLGYYLILLVGRRGVFGHWLNSVGINLIFTWQGAVIAATVVVFPLISNPPGQPWSRSTAVWRMPPAPWAPRNGVFSSRCRCLWPGGVFLPA